MKWRKNMTKIKFTHCWIFSILNFNYEEHLNNKGHNAGENFLPGIATRKYLKWSDFEVKSTPLLHCSTPESSKLKLKVMLCWNFLIRQDLRGPNERECSTMLTKILFNHKQRETSCWCAKKATWKFKDSAINKLIAVAVNVEHA